ncbi:hypothetical protein EPR50_G00014110 [Perca flavescens]|uniref:Small acidic protein-like domain-containing protein n=2 Tax=Perca flavescens TaxID=8167 RepID=A0A484DMF5_PERFV|nr:hypothetical protein EPR50_G00014110 [Perca flavescens]
MSCSRMLGLQMVIGSRQKKGHQLDPESCHQKMGIDIFGSEWYYKSSRWRLRGYKTDSDEDVIFVSEKCARKSNEIIVDQAKRLALQRDIDQQSQPRQLAKPLTSQGSVAVERRVEREKMETGQATSEDHFAKKEKKHKKGQVSLPKKKNFTVDDGILAEVKKEKKKGKTVDVIVIDTDKESSDGGGEKEEKKKKKKRKIVTESLTDGNGSDVNNKKKNGKAVSKKKKQQQQLLAENQVETEQFGSVKEEVEKKQRKKKKVKNKSEQIKPENVKMEKEEEDKEKAEKNKYPKKAKKGKLIIVVNTEEKQIKEKKKKKKTIDDDTTKAMDGVSVTKKKNPAKVKVAENGGKLETPKRETGEVEEVKVKNKKKKEGKTVEKDNLPNKKKDKSTESEIIIIDEGELKKKGGGKKGRKAYVEVSEETEPKKKKRKKGEREEPLVIKCEEVEEQSSETGKKSKRKKSSNKEGTSVEAVSSGTGAKKNKKIKEEVEDQQESPHKDVVFLSEKTGNTDEVTINQERRQALQMEIDKASQPEKPAKPATLGQWSTAQFDSSDQQQKFLRLMGGFKKGFQPATGNGGKANMALGKDAQQQLQQGLLGEFERAQSRRLDFSNRGSGLGFTAPPKNKFSIDINTCRSVRFDD